ncbi:MAG TPA: isochorismatase family cysteine hydrolase [Chloroflexia bacterium]
MVSITPETTQHSALGTQHLPGQAFLSWLDDWVANLPTLDLQAFMQENGITPENVGVISADLVVGFCYEGALASPRIAGVVPNAAEVMKRAYDLGVRQFALVQEYHTHDALEFEQFGPHCIGGTHEAETVEALASLPFADLFSIIHKNTLHPALGTDMDRWLSERPNLDTFVAVGDCTDLCIYQLVMHLKLKGNAANKRLNVIVPADCVQTYDLPVELAQAIGAMPHDGDLLHGIFLYHMALNGARVVKRVV